MFHILSLWDGVVLAIVGSGSFLTLLGTAWRLLSAFTKARSLLTVLLTRVKAACLHPRRELEVDVLGPIIDEKIVSHKVRQFQCLMFLAAVLSSTIVGTYYIVRGADRSIAPADELTMTLSVLYFGAAAALPGVVTAVTLDLHYCVMALFFIIPSLTCIPAIMPRRIAYANVGMVVLNSIRRTVPGQRLPLFLIVNMVYGVSLAWSVVERSGLPMPMLLAAGQLSVVSITCLGSLSLEGGLRAITRRVLELQEVKELYSAACAVLRSSCDVLVELDMEGCMTDGAAELSGFLLRGGASRSLQGVHLSDLMVEEGDRELFTERLKEPRLQKIGLAENVQVTMQDGSGTKLRLELVWFHFSRNTGQRGVTVGIREVSDLLPPFWKTETEPQPLDDSDSDNDSRRHRHSHSHVAGDCQNDGHRHRHSHSYSRNHYDCDNDSDSDKDDEDRSPATDTDRDTDTGRHSHRRSCSHSHSHSQSHSHSHSHSQSRSHSKSPGYSHSYRHSHSHSHSHRRRHGKGHGQSQDHLDMADNTNTALVDTSSQSSGCSSIPEGAAVSGTPGSQPRVMLNALGHGMPIEEVTPSFRSQIGRLPLGVPMVRFVQRPDRFLRWVQDSLNDELYSEEESPGRNVTLQMPTGHLVDTRVTLIPDPHGLEELMLVGEGGRLRLALVFSSVRIRVPHHMQAYAQTDAARSARLRHVSSLRLPAETEKMQL